MNYFKLLTLSSLILASPGAFAAEAPIRSCIVQISGGLPMKLDLYSSKVTTSIDGFGTSISDGDKVTIFQSTIRSDLEKAAAKVAKEMFNPNSGTDSTADLNEAEKFIVQVMILPLIGVPNMNAGFDVTKASSATVFLLGEKTNMGQAGVVVARDKDGKELGSFLGGMSISPCLKAKI